MRSSICKLWRWTVSCIDCAKPRYVAGQTAAKNNNSSIGVADDHGKRIALIIITEEQGYNEYQ